MGIGIKEINKRTLPELFPCTSCTSSDALRVYEHTMSDGSVWHDASCFSCKKYEANPPGFIGNPKYSDKVPSPQVSSILEKHTPLTTALTNEEILNEFKLYPSRPITDRGLTKQTCEKYGVRVSVSPTDGQTIITHMYPYYKKGKLSGYKERIVEGKKIFSKGDCTNAELFGTHACKPNGKTLFITEGELDCLALYQVLKELSGLPGWEPSVVSLSHGAASAAKDISTSMDFVDSFESIVLCFDQDDAGQSAVEDACKLLAGKVYIASYAEKDANEMLLKGKAEELKWDVLKHRQLYMPDSIVNYADCWDRYKNGKNQQCYPWPEGWALMNNMTYGIRLGELVTITAGCVDKDTEFMTPYGWKKISDYQEGDEVLQYHKNGNTSFTKPTNYINEPCDRLWSIKTKYGISQTLSDEHRVIYYSPNNGELKEKTLAEVRGIHSKNATGFRGLIKTSFNTPETEGLDLSLAEIKVQIAVHADGHIHGNKAVLRLKKERKKERLRTLLHCAGIEYTEVDCNSVDGFTRFSFVPPMMTKHYSPSWYQCTTEQLKAISSEVLHWDGDSLKKFFTTSSTCADFIQYCFSALGYRASIQSYLKEGRESTDYVVNISDQDFISFRKTQTSSPRFEPVVPEDGRKYCFTVDTGMLVLRKDSNIFITGNSGVGKTQVMRELKYHFFESTDFKLADIALEEDVSDSIAGLMSLKLNKRITLPDVEVDPDEERKAFEYFFNSGRWTGYDYFGGLDDDNLFSKIRFLAATGHKIIFLDHLSIIVSEFAAEGGERERIDTIMTKLAKMVKELNITIFLVVHLKKSDGKPFEEGYVPTLDDLRGSGTLKQLSWMVMAVARNQQHTDGFCANTSELTILKCRFTGRTGTADYLHFDDDTGRMRPVPKPQNYRPSKKNQYKPSFDINSSPY